MHDSGLWHADLNLQNVLVAADGDVHILDLAGSRIRHPLPEAARHENLARLWRSLLKQRLPHSPFSPTRFLMTYFLRDRDAVRRAAAACRARLRRHRLWWAIAGRGRR
jgi:tRNA A-37 threonylcarbamoyl transferase component Bud32